MSVSLPFSSSRKKKTICKVRGGFASIGACRREDFNGSEKMDWRAGLLCTASLTSTQTSCHCYLLDFVPFEIVSGLSKEANHDRVYVNCKLGRGR